MLRNFLLNTLLALAAFLTCLGLTELFFQLNSRHHWITPKLIQLSGAGEVQSEPLPPEILSMARRKFSRPKYDQKTYRALDHRERRQDREIPHGIPYPLLNFDDESSAAPFVSHQITEIDGTTVIDVRYGLDENHVRLNGAGLTRRSAKKKNILLLGCSYVFGLGVNDDQTTAAYVAREAPEFNVYNLGVPAGSITHVVEDIYIGRRLQGLNKNGGVVIYQYWHDHFPRHFTNLNTLRNNYPVMSRYDFRIESGRLSVRPKPNEKSSWTYRILLLLSQSEFLNFTGWGYNTYSRSYQDQFMDLLVYARDFYLREYNLDFYLLIMNPEDIPSPYFLELLNRYNIRYMLYTGNWRYFLENELSIPGDKHFTPLGNYLYAQKILTRLRRDGELSTAHPPAPEVSASHRDRPQSR